MSSNPKGEPLFSEDLRYWIEMQFGRGGVSLKFVRGVLERRSDDPVAIWHGNILDLELDRATNLLTVATVSVPEIEPEVVSYEEFKRFVLRERP